MMKLIEYNEEEESVLFISIMINQMLLMRMMKIATLKDIAKKANVSIMPISNVINGNRHKVSEEIFEKVSTIIKELNYIPNANSHSFTKKKTKIIALCIPSYFGKSLLGDPYNSYITGAVEKYIQELDYNLMLVSKTKINEIKESLVGWNVDGVIALSMAVINTSMSLMFNFFGEHPIH